MNKLNTIIIMRKILLTLLTTLLCINTEVMAEDFTITPIYTGSYLSPGNLVKVTLSSASVSSGSIQVSKNATGSFTISVNNAPNMYLKSATFTDSQYGTNKQATVSCTSGGTVTDNGSGTYTFTPTNSTTTSATIQLVGNTGGAAKITSLSVIVTNGSTNNMETLSGFSISSGTYSFTSKINGSTVSSSVTLTTETASSWGVNAYNSITAPSSSDSKTITIASDNAIKYIALQDSACRISLVERTSTGGTVSGASWKAPAEGAVKSVTFKNGIGSSVNNVFKIYVITESSCTSHSVTAATSTGTNTYGTVSAASATVCEGSTTTVTASPASGYQVTNWAVSGTGAFISPSGSSSSTSTTLTMGTANATVTVTFGCATPATPTALVASSTTSSGTTLTITDAANTNNYEIYYSTSSTAPEAGTSATTTSTSKTKALTGLSASTTYYVWVRSVCDSTHKSSWTALTGSTFTTDAACTDPSLTITLN